MSGSRRKFMRSLVGGSAASLATWPALAELASSSRAADTRLTPDLVRFDPDIEPVVRRIEETPREKIIETAVEMLRRGLPYRRLLAAQFLAGIRNVNPQPPGFKFHCVFVAHAAHQLSLDAPVEDRLLPLLWVLDDFKKSQHRDVEEGDFRLEKVSGKLPGANKAWREFHAAMEAWDEPRADRAIAVLARTRGALEIIEQLWRYGARDYRNIGHKPIFVANSWRLLQTIGWRHAEPVLRSLVLGLLDFGKSERVNQFAFDDQCYRPNLERAKKLAARLPGDWTSAKGDAVASRALIEAMRGADAESACGTVVQWLANGKIGAVRAWDAVHLTAGELMIRQPGIYGIHTVTSSNALRYAYDTAASRETRLLLLLQGVGWMCQFARFMSGVRGGLNKARIDELEPLDVVEDAGEAIESVFSKVGGDPAAAGRMALGFGSRFDNHGDFIHHARRLLLRKNSEVHGFKYPVAIFEDHRRVSREWRAHMLAVSTYYLRGSGQPDSPVLTKARAALA